MGGSIPGENFLGWNIPGGNSPGGSLMVENFRDGSFLDTESDKYLFFFQISVFLLGNNRCCKVQVAISKNLS